MLLVLQAGAVMAMMLLAVVLLEVVDGGYRMVLRMLLRRIGVVKTMLAGRLVVRIVVAMRSQLLGLGVGLSLSLSLSVSVLGRLRGLRLNACIGTLDGELLIRSLALHTDAAVLVAEFLTKLMVTFLARGASRRVFIVAFGARLLATLSKALDLLFLLTKAVITLAARRQGSRNRVLTLGTNLSSR